MKRHECGGSPKGDHDIVGHSWETRRAGIKSPALLMQWATGKTIIYARPKEAAMLMTAFSGTGSDTKTGAGSPWTHTINPTTTSASSDYYTLLQTLNRGGSTTRYQAVDAVCNKLMLSASSDNPPLKIEADWLGATNSQSTSAFTSSLTTDGPFYWWSGSWTIGSTLRGANASWTAVVNDISLTFENELSPNDFIAETVTPLPLTPGNIKVSGSITLLWQDGGVDAAAYFNGGTSDSNVVVQGDLNVAFTCSTDATQTLAIDIPAASWSSTDLEPDLSGKPLLQKVELVGLRASSGFPYTFTIANTANVTY